MVLYLVLCTSLKIVNAPICKIMSRVIGFKVYSSVICNGSRGNVNIFFHIDVRLWKLLNRLPFSDVLIIY